MHITGSDSAPARVLITGGMGFIGSHLAEALLAQGHPVTVIDDLSTGRFENIRPLTQHADFRYVFANILTDGTLDRLAGENDVIIHLAAAVGVRLIVENPLYTVENNIQGTEAVLKAALHHHNKVLLASTSEVYGKGSRIPFSEDDDTVLGPTSRSRWSYAATKMVDEFMCLAYYHQKDVPVVIFRLFNTVGPRQAGQYGMVVPRFVQQALQGEAITVYGDGQQSRCFLHVGDAVAAIIALANSPEAVGQVFNVGSSEEVTILQLAQRVLHTVDALSGQAPTPPRMLDGGRERIRFVPYNEAYGADFEDMRRRVPDTTKIRHLVGWQPTHTLSDILRDVVGDFVARGPGRVEATSPLTLRQVAENAAGER